jgi:hypothetical protein
VRSAHRSDADLHVSPVTTMKLQRTTLVIAGILVGCSGGLTQVCTLIGCSGALTISVNPVASGPYHIEVVSVTDGQRSYDCADPSGNCTAAKFADYTPDELIVTITNGNGSKQYNIAPAYTNTYANGPNCGATCRSATVSVALP